eukprot:TRINITY_DN6699_c0_g2_i1.p1 TRINITY_DN6699_c0_g2~~TRINITY_DN6699_c0_g2_i1.p1  ORF type:complete len:920 (+),score=215.30 TRINITY_DN6699_c0_g2_i1:84-2762(+)
MAGFRISAKGLMLVAALVSSLVSFAGGLVMYLESLKIVEDTVREISLVELQGTALQLNSTFATAFEASRTYEKLLPAWKRVTTLEELRDAASADIFARMKGNDALYCIGILISPLENTASNPDAFWHMVWWDPLSVGVPKGTREYMTGTYTPEYWGHKECVGEDTPAGDFSKHRCVLSYRLDADNGTRLEFKYAFSDQLLNDVSPSGKWGDRQLGWEQNGATWWRAPNVWYSADRTPYGFGTYMRTVKQQSGHPLWGEGYKLVIASYIIFDVWEDYLNAMDASSTIIATFLDAGLDSQAIASNTDEPLMKPDCAREAAHLTDRHPCLVTLGDINPTIQEACLKANRTESGRFFRTSIGGSEHWVLRQEIIRTTKGHDDMPSPNLVWLRPVSTVEDQLNRSLYFFISFVVAIFIFDIAILVLEINQIAIPLAHLEWAMEPVDRMDLTESTLRLEGAGTGGCLRVTEVGRLLSRFHLTIGALTTYKAYLPQSCLRQEDIAEEESAEQESLPRRATLTSRHRSSAHSISDNATERTMASRSTNFTDAQQQRRTSAHHRMSKVDIIKLRQVQHVNGAQSTEPRVRFITLLAVNKCGFLQSHQFKRTAAAAVSKGVAEFAAAVFQAKGNVDLVSGDHHFASFDAAHRCTGHRLAATRCAWSLRADGDGALSTSAVCCGEALCGDFGSSEMMRFMVVGGLCCELLALERIAAQRRIQVLIDHKVHQDATVTWSCQLIDRVLHPKYRKTPFDIWRVAGKAEDTDEVQEWMYSLAGQVNPYGQYNVALESILNGRIRHAKTILCAQLSAAGCAPQEAGHWMNSSSVAATPPPAAGGEAPSPEVVNALQEAWDRAQSAGNTDEGCPTYRLIRELYLEDVKQAAGDHESSMTVENVCEQNTS